MKTEELFSTKTIRSQAKKIFSRCESGQGLFQIREENWDKVTSFVVEVVKSKYPTLNIPYHSRWGHLEFGRPGRTKTVRQFEDAEERMRRCFELAITSVLLDAGAGPHWEFEEDGKKFTRSEGLAVASFHLFQQGAFSSQNLPTADVHGLKSFDAEKLKEGFQVSDSNPLVGLQGRVDLIRSLGHAVEQNSVFEGGRLGGIADHLAKNAVDGKIEAVALLDVVLNGLGSIWPGRLEWGGRNLGDVWNHSQLGEEPESFVPFHKLSQWLTYSLIEPLEWGGLQIVNLDELTGLAEYRNGGLFLDLGLIEPVHPEWLNQTHSPASDFIIEWRALTVHLLDELADRVRGELKLKASEFPLAKVLEGGSWHAGRKAAFALRSDGTPPIRIESDGTVF